MNLTLRYGRDGLDIKIPDDLETQILHLNALPILDSESEAIESSLRNPIATQALESVARGRENACIVISDVTRPVCIAQTKGPNSKR
jgi:nickel-dependent lactate racemase